MNPASDNSDHLKFAKACFNRTWDFIEIDNRTVEQNDEMLAVAYASLYHWMQAGTAIHRQRGHWMVARIHAILGNSEMALNHAARCMDLTESFSDELQDFDLAFAHECLGRALSLAGRDQEAKNALAAADEAGKAISKKADRDYFFKDLRSGPWGLIRPLSTGNSPI